MSHKTFIVYRTLKTVQSTDEMAVSIEYAVICQCVIPIRVTDGFPGSEIWIVRRERAIGI